MRGHFFPVKSHISSKSQNSVRTRIPARAPLSAMKQAGTFDYFHRPMRAQLGGVPDEALRFASFRLTQTTVLSGSVRVPCFHRLCTEQSERARSPVALSVTQMDVIDPFGGNVG
jgi:hypothetical protein